MPKVNQLAVEPGCLVPSPRILCSAWLSQDPLRCMAVGNMAMADPISLSALFTASTRQSLAQSVEMVVTCTKLDYRQFSAH